MTPACSRVHFSAEHRCRLLDCVRCGSVTTKTFVPAFFSPNLVRSFSSAASRHFRKANFADRGFSSGCRNVFFFTSSRLSTHRVSPISLIFNALQINGEQSRFGPDYVATTLAAVWEAAGIRSSWETFFVDPEYRPNPKDYFPNEQLIQFTLTKQKARATQ